MEDIKGKISYPVDRSVEFVNGVFGMVNNHGEIIINFFCDCVGQPDDYVIQFDDANHGSDAFVHNPVVSRSVKSQIMMNVDVAKSVSEWLAGQVAIAEKIKSGK